MSKKKEPAPIAPTAELVPVLATFGTYEGMVEALKSRRITLGMSQLALEDRAGLASGHVGKIEGDPTKRNNRAIGRDTLPLLLGALKLELAIVPAGVQSVAKHDGQSQAVPIVAGLRDTNFMKKIGAKGGKKSSLLMSPAQRKKRAKAAARTRWAKYRADLKRQKKNKPEPIIVPAATSKHDLDA